MEDDNSLDINSTALELKKKDSQITIRFLKLNPTTDEIELFFEKYQLLVQHHQNIFLIYDMRLLSFGIDINFPFIARFMTLSTLSKRSIKACLIISKNPISTNLNNLNPN